MQRRILELSLLAFILSLYFLAIRGIINFPSELNLGFLTIKLYSVFILAGIALVAYLFHKQKDLYKDLKAIEVEEALFYMLIPALVLARLWHVTTDWYLYSDNWLDIIKIQQGGLGLYGAMIGGLIGAYYYCYRNKVNFIKAVDLLAVFYPLGQIIGRLGNFANQELYGQETQLPWGFYVRSKQGYFNPSFLYEQLGLLIVFAFLYINYRNKRWKLGSGRVALISLAGYAFVRFLVDFFRSEPAVFAIFSVAQTVSLLILIINTIIILRYDKS